MLGDSTWRSCHEHWTSPWFGAAAPSRHITGYLSHQRLVLKNRFRLYRFWRGSASKLFTERNAWLQKVSRGVVTATRAVSGGLYVQQTGVAQLSPTHNFDPFLCQRLCRENVTQTTFLRLQPHHLRADIAAFHEDRPQTSAFPGPSCLSTDQVRGIELVKPGYDDHPSFGFIQSVRQSTHGAIEI